MLDIDLLSSLLNQLLVERSGFAFIPNEYERLPLFCSHCKMIGNDLAKCRVVYTQNHVAVDNDDTKSRGNLLWLKW